LRKGFTGFTAGQIPDVFVPLTMKGQDERPPGMGWTN